MTSRFKVWGITDRGFISQEFEKAAEAKEYFLTFYPQGGELLRASIDGRQIDDLVELDSYIADERGGR